MELIMNKIDVFFTILLGLIQCLYSIRSFRLQKLDSTNDKGSSENFSNTSDIDIAGNENTLNIIQTTIQQNNHYNENTPSPNLKNRASSKNRTFQISILMIFAYIVLNLFQSNTPENHKLFPFSNYIEKFLTVLIQLSNNLLTVSLITSIIVMLFALLFKFKGHLYTGGLFLISSLILKSFIPHFNIHNVLIHLNESLGTSISTTLENIINFIFILCFVFIVILILFVNLSYIANYSVYFTNDSETKNFTITSFQKKLIIPIIPLLLVAIYTYLVMFHGVSDIIEALTSFFKFLIQEVKDQMFNNQ